MLDMSRDLKPTLISWIHVKFLCSDPRFLVVCNVVSIKWGIGGGFVYFFKEIKTLKLVNFIPGLRSGSTY